MIHKKTLVLGASSNPSRYSYLAINSLIAHEHSVLAIGNKKGMVGDVVINNENIVAEDVNERYLYSKYGSKEAFEKMLYKKN